MKHQHIPDDAVSRVAAHFGISVKETRDRWLPLAIQLNQAGLYEKVTGYPLRPDREIESELDMEDLDRLEGAYRTAKATWEQHPDKSAMTDSDRLELVAKLSDLAMAANLAGDKTPDDISARLPQLIAFATGRVRMRRAPPFPELADLPGLN